LILPGIPSCASTSLLPQVTDATNGRGSRTDGQWTGVCQHWYWCPWSKLCARHRCL